MDEENTVQSPRSKFHLGTLGLVLAVVLLLIFFILITQSPGSGGPLIVLVLLSLLFVFLFIALVLGLNVLKRLRPGSFSAPRILYASVSIAAGAVFLIGLQTLSQLQPVDVMLVIAFELLLNFYLLRRF